MIREREREKKLLLLLENDAARSKKINGLLWKFSGGGIFCL